MYKAIEFSGGNECLDKCLGKGERWKYLRRLNGKYWDREESRAGWNHTVIRPRNTRRLNCRSERLSSRFSRSWVSVVPLLRLPSTPTVANRVRLHRRTWLTHLVPVPASIQMQVDMCNILGMCTWTYEKEDHSYPFCLNPFYIRLLPSLNPLLSHPHWTPPSTSYLSSFPFWFAFFINSLYSLFSFSHQRLNLGPHDIPDHPSVSMRNRQIYIR